MLYNGRHAKSEKVRWFYNSLFWLSDKYKVRTFDVFLNMSKFTHFLGGPKGPKICARRAKTDFKDLGSTSISDIFYSRRFKLVNF